VDLDLALLRVFVAVVDHAHFGRAARSLALTQQALSKRIALLEAALGPLLERGGVTPTPSAGCRAAFRTQTQEGGTSAESEAALDRSPSEVSPQKPNVPITPNCSH
jgi:regulatory helix-turn-helix LysR family protein